MSPFSKKKINKNVLVIDVGSASVGVAFVVFSENMAPFVKDSTRLDVSFGEVVDPKRLLLSVSENITKAIKKVVKKDPIDSVEVIFSSPWYKAETQILKYKKDKKFVVTPELVDSVLKKEEKRFERSVVAGNEELEILTDKVIHITLNGYPTFEPFGKKVKEILLHTHLSIIPSSVVDSIENAIEKIIHPRKIHFHPFSLASFASLRNLFPDKDDFLIVDIAGEVTDIQIIYDNILFSSASFPLGKHFIERARSKVFNAPISSKSDIYDLNTSKKVNIVNEEIRKKWVKEFNDTLSKMSKTATLPNTMYIAVDSDVLLFFAEELSEFQKYKTVFLSPEMFNDCIIYKKGVEEDIFLNLGIVYLSGDL